ncbi:MAG: DUF4956 domain-containing protein [Woeseiaceae bacterium]|nr:DUF4956 domain-containing protein [Woeseiaceae bacterium]
MNIFENFMNFIGDPAVEINIMVFTFAIAVASVTGAVVATLYQIFYEQRATGSQIHRSFYLMSPSITTLFIAIQFSLPLSLGLLGALSIVRFRTPIKEPEEIGFLMLLIACSVVCATLQFGLLVVLLAAAVLILVFLRFFPRIAQSKRQDGMVLVSLDSGGQPDACDKIIDRLRSILPSGNLERISTTEDMTTVSYAFLGFHGLKTADIRSSLQEVAPVGQVNIFFNRQGALF